MSRWAAGALMTGVNTSASSHGCGVIAPITTWTGGLQVMGFKEEPAVSPSTGWYMLLLLQQPC